MRISKATNNGIAYARNHYSHQPWESKVKYAYNVWSGDAWNGVILFGETNQTAYPFDKWKGQVYDMHICLEDGTDRIEAARMAIDAFGNECPCVDLVTSREKLDGLFAFVGKYGDGKHGAFVVNGERLHPKRVKQFGWRTSVLWLREHVDNEAIRFDREAQNMYVFPMTDEMKRRIKILEVR